jgi:hypothetical protein
VLAIDRDTPALGKIGKVDAVAAAVEAQLDTVVDEPFAPHPLADAGLD